MGYTKTPWVVRGKRDIRCLHSQEGIAQTVYQVDEQAEANAQFIVKACNAHEALVDVVSRYITHCGNRGVTWMGIEDQDKLYQDAHNALMLAEG